ncbi:MAG: hypothetical protein AB7P03_05375 [Kofleriaceae bacterium]
MRSRLLRTLATFGLAGGLAVVQPSCASSPPVRLTEDWPAAAGDYDDIVDDWTRKATMRGMYQEAFDVAATFKSPQWRAAHAEREADHRGLEGAARQQVIDQAKAAAAGPYEFELLVTTWDERENDLHRGKKSVWKVALLDAQGNEIEPLEIVRDKRPPLVLRAEYPAFGDFATAYIARFPRTAPVLGPDVRALTLRMSNPRGGVSLVWVAN